MFIVGHREAKSRAELLYIYIYHIERGCTGVLEHRARVRVLSVKARADTTNFTGSSISSRGTDQDIDVDVQGNSLREKMLSKY